MPAEERLERGHPLHPQVQVDVAPRQVGVLGRPPPEVLVVVHPRGAPVGGVQLTDGVQVLEHGPAARRVLLAHHAGIHQKGRHPLVQRVPRVRAVLGGQLTSFSKYGLKKGPQGKSLIVQLPLSTDLDLDLDLCRSTDDGDLDLLEEPRFWLFSGIGDLLTDRDLLRLLLLDLL